MKTMNINFAFTISNGEWQEDKKIERTSKFSHSIDLELMNDESTFPCVMNRINHEFEDNVRKAINTVMQRMIDEKPDALYDEDGNAYADSCGGAG